MTKHGLILTKTEVKMTTAITPMMSDELAITTIIILRVYIVGV